MLARVHLVSSPASAFASAKPSRAPSPFLYYSGTSSCDSDSESEPESPLLGGIRRRPGLFDDERPRWWLFRLGTRGHGETWRRRRGWEWEEACHRWVWEWVVWVVWGWG